MNIRIYISKNTGLPRVEDSFKYIQERIASVGLGGENLHVVDAPPDRFEYLALDKCWEDSQENDFYGLYLHCKGASKTDEIEFKNGLAWLNYMLYGLLDNYKLCVEHMDKGADLVGSMWYKHFKGNCFWFKSSYVRPLIRPMALDIGNRYTAEYWCSQAYWFNSDAVPPRVKNLFYMPISVDADFLGLENDGYVPDIENADVCDNLSDKIANGDYSVFDELVLTSTELGKYKDVLKKYLNYDAKITIKNEQI